MRRPAAAAPLALLLLLAFALLGAGGLLLLLHQVQTTSCGGLPTKATKTRQLLPPHPAQGRRRLGGGAGAEEKARLGSRPPSCRGKCNECSPCAAVQVPALATTTLSNYKPMGWKCQCRDRLYQP
ncbi:EPIDERMAL PATTERNING FACTOR-like protein 3 [Miscanthus floridulus]|uniref:EPIDERMAL PATTERNING FACTOR-like protein 3 n=1 Tax=Miscanthus floridulus TaxID=154761 RepID=UPI00345915CB